MVLQSKRNQKRKQEKKNLHTQLKKCGHPNGKTECVHILIALKMVSEWEETPNLDMPIRTSFNIKVYFLQEMCSYVSG